MKDIIKTLSGNELTSFAELISALGPDGQGSGTVQGWLSINENIVFIRKHWSYSGGFPFHKDETLDKTIGEILLDEGRSYCEGDGNGGGQELFNDKGVLMNDAQLSVKWID